MNTLTSILPQSREPQAARSTSSDIEKPTDQAEKTDAFENHFKNAAGKQKTSSSKKCDTSDSKQNNPQRDDSNETSSSTQSTSSLASYWQNLQQTPVQPVEGGLTPFTNNLKTNDSLLEAVNNALEISSEEKNTSLETLTEAKKSFSEKSILTSLDLSTSSDPVDAAPKTFNSIKGTSFTSEKSVKEALPLAKSENRESDNAKIDVISGDSNSISNYTTHHTLPQGKEVESHKISLPEVKDVSRVATQELNTTPLELPKRIEMTLETPKGTVVHLYLQDVKGEVRAQFSTNDAKTLEWLQREIPVLRETPLETNVKWLPPQMNQHEQQYQQSQQRQQQQERQLQSTEVTAEQIEHFESTVQQIIQTKENIW